MQWAQSPLQPGCGRRHRACTVLCGTQSMYLFAKCPVLLTHVPIKSRTKLQNWPTTLWEINPSVGQRNPPVATVREPTGTASGSESQETVAVLCFRGQMLHKDMQVWFISSSFQWLAVHQPFPPNADVSQIWQKLIRQLPLKIKTCNPDRKRLLQGQPLSRMRWCPWGRGDGADAHTRATPCPAG